MSASLRDQLATSLDRMQAAARNERAESTQRVRCAHTEALRAQQLFNALYQECLLEARALNTPLHVANGDSK